MEEKATGQILLKNTPLDTNIPSIRSTTITKWSCFDLLQHFQLQKQQQKVKDEEMLTSIHVYSTSLSNLVFTTGFLLQASNSPVKQC